MARSGRFWRQIFRFDGFSPCNHATSLHHSKAFDGTSHKNQNKTCHSQSLALLIEPRPCRDHLKTKINFLDEKVTHDAAAPVAKWPKSLSKLSKWHYGNRLPFLEAHLMSISSSNSNHSKKAKAMSKLNTSQLL